MTKNRNKKVEKSSKAEPSSVSITMDELKTVKLFVGMPMYGGLCNGLTAKSLIELSMYCSANGIEFYTHYLFNESLVQRARNYIADEFLRSDCTHLLFIDADIGFKYTDVVTLLAFNMKDKMCGDVVAAVYPRKTIAWEKVDKAAKSGMISNPNMLEDYSGDFVFNFKENTEQFNIYNPLEVAETGTGFMLIPRHVLEKFQDAYPEYRYTPDHIRSANFDGSRQITAFFHCEIDPVSNRYLSEDYFFCRKLSKIGVKTAILPWIELSHTGTFVYKGSIAKMASLQVDLVSGGYKDGKEGII